MADLCAAKLALERGVSLFSVAFYQPDALADIVQGAEVGDATRQGKIRCWFPCSALWQSMWQHRSSTQLQLWVLHLLTAAPLPP